MTECGDGTGTFHDRTNPPRHVCSTQATGPRGDSVPRVSPVGAVVTVQRGGLQTSLVSDPRSHQLSDGSDWVQPGND